MGGGAGGDPIGRPRNALPELGLLCDPQLFETNNLAKRLENNLLVCERVTILSPGEIRQRRERLARYKNHATAELVNKALDRLEAYRRGQPDAGLTLEDAERIVKLPQDREINPTIAPDEIDGDEEEEDEPELYNIAVDSVLDRQENDLEKIGEALETAWKEFDLNSGQLVCNKKTSQGIAKLDQSVDLKIIDWVTAFCDGERFGGFMEASISDLKQALARYTEFDPVFLDPENVWNHDGVTYSIEKLLKEWDSVDQVATTCQRPIAEVWRKFINLRSSLAEQVRPLLIHPREWLDTHPKDQKMCKKYLALAQELYGQVHNNYKSVWKESRELALATLDAILALDLLQVRIMDSDGRKSAKVVMLPLHPLHLWRYQRFGDILRELSKADSLSKSDRKIIVKELRRPEQFVSVIRTGKTPDSRGLNQLLPVANTICGLATFENFHNAISNADGMETLVLALDHFVMLYPNHPRPLRLTLVNPPESERLLERLTKFLNERRNTLKRLPALCVRIVATEKHKDRLISALALEGNAQDLVYEKVAAGRLDLRVAPEPFENLSQLVEDDLSMRPQHIIAIFDESSMSLRSQRVERQLPMSPFCVRQDILVDRLLGKIKLEPNTGEPPFYDFVNIINKFEEGQHDSTIVSSADANKLRSTIDSLLQGKKKPAHWVFLADRALPIESGMKSTRLLQRKDGHRKVLLSATDYGQLETLMKETFSNCNLTISEDSLDSVLRQGVNLVGTGLLEMINKNSGRPDNNSVLGFVGMLLATRKVKSEDKDALVASVDGEIARLWLKLGPKSSMKRCDLIAFRQHEDKSFRLTCIEVKTTKDAELSSENNIVERAADQIEQTAEVVLSAISGDDPFAAPRSEMLKEVLVRAASNRWGTDEHDKEQRKIWGPLLKDLFDDCPNKPKVKVDGDIFIVKLRSNDREKVAQLKERKIPISVRTITEAAVEELLDNYCEMSSTQENCNSDDDISTLNNSSGESDVKAGEVRNRCNYSGI